MKRVCARISIVTLFLLIVFQVGFSAERQKIILDTDLGSDIDDAFALGLILASPEYEVLGITLDHGLTKKRAQVVARLLYETGRTDIPIAVGRQTPNVVGVDQELAGYAPQFHWGEGFDKITPINTPAPEFIISLLKKYPHEVILFTIGPVPNIGDVVRKDPQALQLAKHIYSMFGSFYMGYSGGPIPDAEWNVRADVQSAQLLASAGAPITFAGLDITTFVKLDQEQRQKLAMRHSTLTDALSALYTLWGHETPTLYDVVAVSMPLWPDLFQTRPAHVKVLDGGYTVIDESAEPNAEVGMHINTSEFIRRIMQRYLEFKPGQE